VKKNYLAIVDGKVEQKSFEADYFLGLKKRYAGGSIYAACPAEKGKRAITHFTCLKQGKDASLLKCVPITGRTHQIRVQLKELGHPVLGDYQYCREFKCVYRPTRLLLHAQSLSFFHPLTGEEMHMTAPIPKDFLRAQKKIFS